MSRSAGEGSKDIVRACDALEAQAQIEHDEHGSIHREQFLMAWAEHIRTALTKLVQEHNETLSARDSVDPHAEADAATLLTLLRTIHPALFEYVYNPHCATTVAAWTHTAGFCRTCLNAYSAGQQALKQISTILPELAAFPAREAAQSATPP